MKKSKAWTIIELMISMIIIGIISVVMMSAFKPKQQQERIFIYATLRNLNKANIALVEKYETLQSGSNWYCKHLLNLFSLEGSAQCSNNDTKNATLANGVEIKGLAGDWTELVSDDEDFVAPYKYKDILIDIDGFSSGLNKIGVDEFPLRIYNSNAYNGAIFPIDCSGANIVYDDNGKSVTIPKSSYCSDSTFNFLNDNSIMAYDVYKGNQAVTEDGEEIKTTLVTSAISPIKADCIAYGGNGAFNKIQCSTLGYRLSEKCATDKTCAECDSDSAHNICPSIDAYPTTKEGCLQVKSAYNSTEGDCFTLLKKPSIGAGFFVDSLFTDIFME